MRDQLLLGGIFLPISAQALLQGRDTGDGEKVAGSQKKVLQFG